MACGLNFAYRIANQAGMVILEGETLHVCTGLDEKPKRLPEALAGRKMVVHAHYTPLQQALIGEVKMTIVSEFPN